MAFLQNMHKSSYLLYSLLYNIYEYLHINENEYIYFKDINTYNICE